MQLNINNKKKKMTQGILIDKKNILRVKFKLILETVFFILKEMKIIKIMYKQ